MGQISTGKPLSLALFFIRVYVGIALLPAGWSKVRGTFLDGVALAKSVRGWLDAGDTYAFAVPFFRETVLEHARLFAFLIAYGELVGGALLAIGLLTRPAALGSFLLVLSILIGQGERPWSLGTAAALLPMLFCVLLTAPGRVLGLDAALQGKLPRWLV
ncbi:MAG: DoxX family protein [Myxococcota bacterium]